MRRRLWVLGIQGVMLAWVLASSSHLFVEALANIGRVQLVRGLAEAGLLLPESSDQANSWSDGFRSEWLSSRFLLETASGLGGSAGLQCDLAFLYVLLGNLDSAKLKVPQCASPDRDISQFLARLAYTGALMAERNRFEAVSDARDLITTTRNRAQCTHCPTIAEGLLGLIGSQTYNTMRDANRTNVEIYQLAITVAPDQPIVYLRLANYYKKQQERDYEGAWRNALGTYQLLLQNVPSYAAETYLRIADSYAHMADYNLTVDAANHALTDGASPVWSYYYMGQAARESGRVIIAKEHYQQVVSVTPSPPGEYEALAAWDARVRLAEMAVQERDYDAGLVWFRDALRFASHPEWQALTHFRLGQLRHLQGCEDDAIEEYLLAKSSISPESQRPLFVSITNALGDSYFVTGQKELAISAYREVLQADPADAHALDMLKALER